MLPCVCNMCLECGAYACVSVRARPGVLCVCAWETWAAVRVHVSACVRGLGCSAWVRTCVCVSYEAWAAVHVDSLHSCNLRLIWPQSSLPISQLSNKEKCLISFTDPFKAPGPPKQCPHQLEPQEGYQGGGLGLGCSHCCPAGQVGTRYLHARLGNEEGHGWAAVTWCDGYVSLHGGGGALPYRTFRGWQTCVGSTIAGMGCPYSFFVRVQMLTCGCTCE